jgi:hypothetical protein
VPAITLKALEPSLEKINHYREENNKKKWDPPDQIKGKQIPQIRPQSNKLAPRVALIFNGQIIFSLQPLFSYSGSVN